jgi:hypothetical protein
MTMLMKGGLAKEDAAQMVAGRLERAGVKFDRARANLLHDRPHHLEQRRITYLLRRALGDLFLGTYRVG